MATDRLSSPTREAMIVVGARLRVLQWDAQAFSLLGWSEVEAVNRPLSLILSDADLRRIRPDIELMLRAGTRPVLRCHTDCRLHHKQDRQISATLLMVPVHLRGRPCCGLILQPGSAASATVRDLRGTLWRRETTLDTAQIGLVEWDLARGILWKSRRGVALVTGDPDTSLHTFEQFLAFVHPEDRALIQDAAERATREGTMQQVEFRVCWPNGETHWISTRGTAIRDASGRYNRIFAVEMDVTRRKNAEAQLKVANQRIETILESITDAFFSLDECWRFVYINKRAEELLAREKEDLLGKNVWVEFPDAIGIFLDKYRHARDSGQPVRFEDFYPPLQTWFDVHAYPYPDGLSVFFADVTQQKHYEQSLRRLSRQLQRAQERERTRIAREIHDELGSSLAALKMGISRLLLDVEKLPGGQAIGHRDLPDQVDTMVEAMRRIIDDLRPSILDHLGLWAALEWLAHQFEERHDIRCTFLLLGEECLVEPERATAIFRIVQEALTNVAKHAAASEVDIDAMITGHRVAINIRDNGCGIDPDRAARPDAHGLFGIRERAGYFGGTVTIGANSPKGLVITIDMPLRAGVAERP